jgi:hypothetical protein
MEIELASFLFLGICFAYGIFASIWPDKIVAYYKKCGWLSENPLLGSYYYSTPKRARITGSVLAVFTFVVSVLGFFRHVA